MESRGLRGLVCLVVALIVSTGSYAAQDFASIQPHSIASLGTEVSPAESDLNSYLSSQWQLKKIGNEFAKPIRILAPLQQTAVDLPAVPATITLTICGFLCVSLVRDRRAWFALVAGILWLGSTGIHAIPELNNKLCSRISSRISSPTGLNQPAVLISNDDVAGNSPITRFIGLLRKLEGIPGIDTRIILSDHICSITTSTRKVGGNSVWRFSAPDESVSSQAHLEQCNWTERQIVCPACAARYFNVFEPGFIFSNLSRGPPVRPSKSFVSLGV